MHSQFDQMGGTYHQEGDFLLPDLDLPDAAHYSISLYGRLRKTYLKDHHPGLYSAMFLNGTLHQHLADTDRACNDRMECLVRQMAERECVTEELKASSQLE